MPVAKVALNPAIGGFAASSRYVGFGLRAFVIRPQAILVLLLVVVVVSLGAATVARDAEPDRGSESERPLDIFDSGTPLVADAEPTPPTPPVVTSAIEPEPTPTRTPEPTETPVPQPTERPAPPPVADTDQSVIIERGMSGREEVALTFDAGQGRGYTEQILDLLADEGVTATFGVTGEWAEANPDLMRRIVADGHMVLNHTYDHSSYTGASTGAEPLTSDQFVEQLQETERIIADLTGYRTAPFFRFPYGDYDANALADVARAGYAYTVWWSCDSLAWQGDTAAQIVQKCGVEEAEPGAIILLHVDPIADFEALPGLIATLRDQGYELVTIEEMLQP